MNLLNILYFLFILQSKLDLTQTQTLTSECGENLSAIAPCIEEIGNSLVFSGSPPITTTLVEPSLTTSMMIQQRRPLTSSLPVSIPGLNCASFQSTQNIPHVLFAPLSSGSYQNQTHSEMKLDAKDTDSPAEPFLLMSFARIIFNRTHRILLRAMLFRDKLCLILQVLNSMLTVFLGLRE